MTSREHRSRAPLWSLALCALLPWIAPSCSEGAPAPERAHPPIILIIVDTLRAEVFQDESGQPRTRELAQLAEDGVSFPHAFSHAALTLPSHTALLSSRVPRSTGVVLNGQQVPEDLPFLQEHLRAAGYQSGAVASLSVLHGGQLGGGIERGFDRFERVPHGMRNADETLEQVRSVLADFDRERPFFLLAHFADPHEPYCAHGELSRTASVSWNGDELESVELSELRFVQRTVAVREGKNELRIASEHPLMVRRARLRGAPALDLPSGVSSLPAVIDSGQFVARTDAAAEREALLELWLCDVPESAEKRARYLREVAYVDGRIGEFLEQLRAEGLYDESLIVFTSDHGEALGERGLWGHGGTVFDSMLHVPLMIKPPRSWEGRAELAAQRERQVRHIDVVPTLLEILDLSAFDAQQGHSLLSPGPNLLEACAIPPQSPHRLHCLRDEEYKLIYDVTEGAFSMYAHGVDREESNDVYAEQGAQRPEWERMLLDIGSRAVDAPTEFGAETAELLDALGY